MPALYINDVDVATLGFRVETLTGLLGSTAPASLPGLEVPGRAGAVPVSTAPRIGMRQATAQLAIARQLSLAAMEQAFVQLNALAGNGRVELRDGRDPTKVVNGLLLNSEELALGVALVPPLASRVPLRFECDPYRRDVSARTTGPLGTTPLETSAGTAPTSPILSLTGNDPVVRLRTLAGILLATMGFTVTLGANDYLQVDCRTLTITKYAAGTPSDAYSTWTTKADGPLILDPHDGDPAAGRGPLLELSSASNGGVALYTRHWR